MMVMMMILQIVVMLVLGIWRSRRVRTPLELTLHDLAPLIGASGFGKAPMAFKDDRSGPVTSLWCCFYLAPILLLEPVEERE